MLVGDYRDGLASGGKRLLFYGASLQGYWNFELDETERVWARAYATFRQQRSGRFSLAGTLQGVMTHNLPPDEQLLGGGDTGLRGYPSRYQSGDRSVLFSLEERYFSDIYIARILRLGFAAFFDVGRTWFSDNPDDHGYGALADVGIGLRFESTRTRQDRVLHVDFAFPLVDGPDVQAMQILRGRCRTGSNRRHPSTTSAIVPQLGGHCVRRRATTSPASRATRQGVRGCGRSGRPAISHRPVCSAPRRRRLLAAGEVQILDLVGLARECPCARSSSLWKLRCFAPMPPMYERQHVLDRQQPLLDVVSDVDDDALRDFEDRVSHSTAMRCTHRCETASSTAAANRRRFPRPARRSSDPRRP